MIGRLPALRRLLDLVEAADIGCCDRPEVALVSGESGIGKTRLMRELIAHAPPTTTVFTMSAQPGSSGRALDAVCTMARSRSGSPEWERIGRQFVDAASEEDPADAVVEFVGGSMAGGPVLVIVEDLHWIDAASALVVDRLTQEPWSRMVVVATYRSEELSPGAPGGGLVQRLERRHDVERIRLEPLDRAEVAALVAAISGHPGSSALVETLFRRSGGNPFVVEELHGCGGPGSTAEQVASASLPWSLEEAVRVQVAGFGGVERAVSETLAVFGAPMSFDHLAAVVSMGDRPATDDEVLSALRSLVANDVVVEVHDDVFSFAHALVASAIESQLLGRERRRLHERCADVLQADPGADPATLARHVAGAGRYDELVDIARTGAARYLDQGATFQALRLAAQGLTEEPDDPELLAVATDAAWRIGFTDEAVVTARRWVDVDTDVERRIDGLRLLGRLGLELGDDTIGERARDELAALAEQATDPRIEGLASVSLAQLEMLRRRSDTAVAWADRASAAARQCGDASIEARATVERASARVFAGLPYREVADELRRAVRAAREQPDPVLLARAINNLLDSVPPQSEEAEALRAELVGVGRAGGFDTMTRGVNWWVAEGARCRGDLGAFRRAIDDARQWWLGEQSVLTAFADARLAFEDGRIEDARRSFDAYAAAAGELDRRYELPFALVLAAAAGQRDEARRLFADLLDGPALPDGPRTLDEVLGVVEAALTVGVGPDDIARDVLDVWFAGHPSSDEVRCVVSGVLLAASEDHEAAVAALRAAIDDPDPRLSVYWIGSLRTLLAASLLALGRRDEARTEVRHVLDHELARWPGVRRDRAEQLARRLEGSSERSDGELTRRELEVAALLAEGLTNGQLADRLFISPKTAAVHVSNILTKLGLSSRAEIAAWAVRNGLD
jgi:DNA-binding NarL/FixJ family response regulator